jgi:hypothetical protein
MDLMLTEQELINLGLPKEKIQELIDSKTKDSKPKWQDELPKVGEEASIFSFSLKREKVSFETEIQHAFNTKFNVAILAKKLDLLIRMSNFALIKNDGWEADWCNLNEKYGLYIRMNEVVVSRGFSNNYIFGITFKTHDIAKEALNEFGNEIIEVFLKSKIEEVGEEENHSKVESTPIEEIKVVSEENVSERTISVFDEIIRQNFKEFVKSRASKEFAKKFCASHGIDLETLLFFFKKYNLTSNDFKIYAKSTLDSDHVNYIFWDIQKGVHFLDLKKLYGFPFASIIKIANERGYFLNKHGFFVDSISENIDIEKANKSLLLIDKKLPYISRYLSSPLLFEDLEFIKKVLNKNYNSFEVMDFFNLSRSAFYKIGESFDLPYHNLKRSRTKKPSFNKSSVLKNKPYIAQLESVEKEPTEPVLEDVSTTENINQEEEKKEFVLPPKIKKWWQL